MPKNHPDNELNPFIFNNFDMDGRVLKVIGKPLEFYVREEILGADRDPSMYYSAHGDFNIQCMEENLGQLERSVIEEVFFLYDNYALEEDNKMTKSAVRLAKELRKALVEVK